MKKIPLKVYKETLLIGGVESEQVFTSINLLRTATNHVDQRQGVQIDEMMKRLRVMEVLDKHTSVFKVPELPVAEIPESFLNLSATMDIEDADHETLKSAVKAMPWAVNARAIIDVYKSLQ